MRARPSLLGSLRAAHLRLGLSAVAAAGLILSLVAVLTLRATVDQNLTLVARSISYTAQAATVFGDAGAAQEVLTSIAAREGLQSARIVDREARSLATFEARSPLDAGLVDRLAALLAPQAQAPIEHEGRTFGEVRVLGDGRVYLHFMLKVLAGIGLCALAIAGLVARLARGIEADIVRPLNRLASLTRTARTERALALRAPSARVREIHELGEDFNALLGEIQSREASLVAKHDTLKTANESLSHLAFHDSLTGLPNRAAFLERATKAVQGQRGGRPEHKVAVLYLDCDRFKAINDALGHAAGDVLLVEVAARIRMQLRDGDFVARLGGDEFAVLLSPIRAVDDAARIAAKIAAALRAPIAHAVFGPIASSASVGIAVFPDHGGGVDALLAAADAAMYRAKSNRPGSCEVFDAALDDVTRPMVA